MEFKFYLLENGEQKQLDVLNPKQILEDLLNGDEVLYQEDKYDYLGMKINTKFVSIFLRVHQQ